MHGTLPDRIASGPPQPKPFRAGLLYFLAVFAMGFVLGTLRTLWLADIVGELTATLIEIPIILIFAWFIAQPITRLCDMGNTVRPRITMGLFAFALLMVAEAVLAMTLMGRTLSEHWASYSELPKWFGLNAQIVFALIPAAQINRKS